VGGSGGLRCEGRVSEFRVASADGQKRDNKVTLC
jgi:hypothetical protein